MRSIYRVDGLRAGVPRTSSRARSTRPQACGARWRRASAPPGSTTCASCRSPTAVKARSTRCSRRAAARAVRRPSPGRSATRSTPSGRCCRAGPRWSRWRERAGSRSCDGRNDPLRASTRGTGELIAAALRAGARRVVVGVGGSATTDGGLAAVEALGWSLGAAPSHRRVRRRRPRSSTRRAVFGAAEGRDRRPGGAAHPPARAARRPVRAAHRRRRPGAARVRARRVGSPVAWPRSARELEPGFDVVAGAAGLEAALDGVDLVVTGEGRLDATSFEGKVVGGVLEWAADAGVAARRRSSPGRSTADAREELARARRASSCSRSPTGSGSRARRSPAPRCWSRRPRSTPARRALDRA